MRTLKFGPLVRSPPASCPSGLEPYEFAASSVWQPEQRSLKSVAPARCGVLGLDLAAAAGEPGEGDDRQRGRKQARETGGSGARAGILSAARAVADPDTGRPRRPVGLRGRRQAPAHRDRAGRLARRIDADEYSFDPGRVIVTGAPRELRITLDNVGSLAHNIRVLDGDRDLGGVRSFPSGEQRETTVRVPVRASTGSCARWAITRSWG